MIKFFCLFICSKSEQVTISKTKFPSQAYFQHLIPTEGNSIHVYPRRAFTFSVNYVGPACLFYSTGKKFIHRNPV